MMPVSPSGLVRSRVAAVMGASSGIGRASAVRLASEGAKVFALARRTALLDELAAECAGIVPVTVDVTDEDAVFEAAEVMGRLDIVVACAGTIDAAVPGARWRDLMEVNLGGVMHAAYCFHPNLESAASEAGVADLVIVSSNAVRELTARRSAYHASKAAVSMLGACWRIDFAEEGIRVTTIEPGMVHTELVERPSGEADRAALRAFDAEVQGLDPDAVADLITYAVSRPRGVNLSQVAILPTRQV